MRLVDPSWLNALWIAPALALLFVWAGARRRALLARFIEAGLLPAMSPDASAARRAAKAALLIVAAALIAVALARPAWSPRPREVRTSGRDVIFVVDVSRSMLADDLKPSRLERAKLAIADVLGSLKGDRVALVAFAGTSVVKCPLTLDYAFMRMAVDDLAPGSVSRGGTLIGDALRRVVADVFEEDTEGFRDIILITDGEDHESFPVEAAMAAGDAGARIIAIGLGDERVGRRIPAEEGFGQPKYLTYDGREVVSRLDADTLRKVASATKGGVYFNVATGNINLDEVYTSLIREAERRELESRTAVIWDEKYYIFLSAALALVAVEACLGERRRA